MMHRDYDEYLNGHTRMIERDDERAAEGDRQYDAMKDRMALDEPILQPCPFCGGTAMSDHNDLDSMLVMCSSCSALVTGKSESDATRNWNRRTS